MAAVARMGFPTLMVTFTGSPTWPEALANLLPDQTGRAEHKRLKNGDYATTGCKNGENESVDTLIDNRDIVPYNPFLLKDACYGKGAPLLLLRLLTASNQLFTKPASPTNAKLLQMHAAVSDLMRYFGRQL